MSQGNKYGAAGQDAARGASAGTTMTTTAPGGNTPLLAGDAHPLSWQTKLAFALGALPNAISVTTTGFFLNPFLLEVSGVTAGIVSALMLVGRAWDALTTALVGAMVAKCGGLRKWLIIWIAPCSLAYFFLWFVVGGSAATKAAFAFAMYLSYQLFSSAYQVPYTAITVHLHNSAEERDKATTWRMLAEILSVLVGAGVQGIILGAYDANDICDSCDSADDSNDAAKAYLISAVVMTVLFGTGGVVCFFGVSAGGAAAHTSADEEDDLREQKPGAKEGLRAAMGSRAFVCLTFAYFFIWLTVQAVQGNIMLYCKYSVPAYKDSFQLLLGVLVLCATLGMPCWLIIMRKIGKRNAYLCGAVGFAPLLHVMYWLPKDAPLWPAVIVCALAGFALASTYLLPWSMMPNVLDEVEYVTGKRYEAVFYAFFVFFMKMGAGIALAGSALVLSAAGWVNDPCCIAKPEAPDGVCDCSQRDLTCECDVQPAAIGDALRIIVGIAGPLLIAVGIVLAWLYPLTPAREREVQVALAARRDAEGTSPLKRQNTSELGASMRLSVALSDAISFGPSADHPSNPRHSLPLPRTSSGVDVRPRSHTTQIALPSPGMESMKEVKTG
eukprot:TRINITY_DN60039_c0_g1_i1.p1 TRINITY_DN60039_c0_g1~~TRINITY_DN60039_c0_g1_i1.p1  ORF type:complete len:641 (+),score=181.15 TRINITY_DN60039_c0_g1_i1:93-1925(+)